MLQFASGDVVETAPGVAGTPAARRNGNVSNIPAQHNGYDYGGFLAELAAKRGTVRYLEIGVSKGSVLERIPARVAVGVDPGFELTCNVAKGKRITTLIHETSDAFFASEELRATLSGPPDLTFLDGMHTFEYLLRDFFNTERFGTRSSLIAMHDCLPLDEVMAIRHLREHADKTHSSTFPGWWTGDVWKVIPILKTYRPDLRVVCVNCPPTGLVLVTNLDPSSTVLQDNYLDIVSEFQAVPNNRASLEELYGSIEIIDAATILREFDHSLYFRV